MWRYFTEIGNHKYIDILDDLIENYNNFYHRSMKMTPIEASKYENKTQVLENLYPKPESR